MDGRNPSGSGTGADRSRRMNTGDSSQGFSWRRVLTAGGPFLGLLLVIGLFSINTGKTHFLTGANFKIIFLQTVVVAIGAMGMTMIIISGGIDLSVGSVVAFTSVVGA